MINTGEEEHLCTAGRNINQHNPYGNWFVKSSEIKNKTTI